MPAQFEFTGGGIGVMPDPADNPDGHTVPHSDAGTRISVEVANVGDAGGNADVRVELDGAYLTDWQSAFLLPGSSDVGYVPLGRLGAGDHSVLTYVNPGSGQADHETNDFSVG